MLGGGVEGKSLADSELSLEADAGLHPRPGGHAWAEIGNQTRNWLIHPGGPRRKHFQKKTKPFI